jgi:hypothetical protein
MTAAELSGDATTSGSNAVTVVKINGNSIPSGATSHQVPVATAANTLTWKTIANCPSSGATNAETYDYSTDTWGCNVISTLANPMTTLGDVIYGGASGTVTRLPGPTAPATTFILSSTPSGGAATAPTWNITGVAGRTVSGTSDTILGSDRSTVVQYTSSSATAVVLPQAGTGAGTSSDFSKNYVIVIQAGNGIVTVTPTTSTINGKSTLTIQNGFAFIYSLDNTNYLTNYSPGNNGVIPLGTDTGSTNAYVVNYPGMQTLAKGAICPFSATNSNTGASTLNCSGTGVKSLTKAGATALVLGDVAASPAIAYAVYDGTQWEDLSPWSAPGGITAAVAAYPSYYSSTTTIAGGFNPLISNGFDIGNTDRCLAMHDAVVANTNGVQGDSVDARGELSTSMVCNTNPFLTVLDVISGNPILGGTEWMPAGQTPLNVTGGAYMDANQFSIHGTTVGSGQKGGTSFQDERGSAGSGKNFSPAVFAWGKKASQLMGTGANNAGNPGPYSSNLDSVQFDCNSDAGEIGLTAFSGQDNTYLQNMGFSNCPVASMIIGTQATGNGEQIRGFYSTHSGPSCIGNTVGAGGTPWTSNAYTITNIGNNRAVVVMTAPTGGLPGGNGISAALTPGVATIVGAYGANGTAVPNGTVHATNINGDYEIAAVSDVSSVSSITGTGGAANAVYLTLTISGNDFPVDSAKISEPSTGGCDGSQSPTAGTYAQCNGDAVIYLSGFTGGATSLNGATMTIGKISGSSVSGWVSTTTTGYTTSTGTAAYSNTINGNEQSNNYQYLGAASTTHATPFTAAGQIAWTIANPSAFTNNQTCNSLANSCMDSHDNTSPGTITAFTRGFDIDSPSNTRGIAAGTIVARSCTNFAGGTPANAGSERPLHNVEINNIGMSLNTLHLEDSYHASVEIGNLDFAGNITLTDLLPVTNPGKIGSASNTNSDLSAAVHLSSNFGTIPTFNLFNLRSGPGLGANQALYALKDDADCQNAFTSAALGSNVDAGNIGFYLVDSSGTGCFTNANPTATGLNTMQNGVNLFNNTLGFYSGSTTPSVTIANAGMTLQNSASVFARGSVSGVELGNAVAVTNEGTTADATYNVGNLGCVTATLSVIGDCGSTAANPFFVGVLVAKNGTIPVYAVAGTVSVNSQASTTFTAKETVCTDASNPAKVINNGINTPCVSPQRQVGIVKTTNTGTSHTVTLQFSAGTASATGTVTSVTFTGDGTVLSSTPSGAVTTTGTLNATLANAGAGTVLGNVGASSAIPAYTSVPVLGKSGTVGTIGFGNATSGTVTLGTVTGALGSVTASLPANTGTIAETNLAETFSALQTFGTNISIGGVTAAGATGTGNVVFASTPTLTTPVIGAATGTSLLVTGTLDGNAPITITTGTTANLGTTFHSGYTFNQEATAGTGVTYTLPATAAGLQYCVQNSGTTGVVNTGVLTVYPPASSFVILNGVVNTVGGGGTHGVASAGAAGDGACFVAIDATHWEVFPLKGTWTEN